MSAALDTQIRSFAEYFEEIQDPLTVAEVLDRAAPIPTLPDTRGPRRPMRRWAIVAAVAIGVIVVALNLIFASTRTDPEPVTSTTHPPSTSSTTTPSTTVGPGPAEASGSFSTPLGQIEWRHIAGNAGSIPLPKFSWDLVKTASGFFALDAVGALWRSTDGYEWEPLQDLNDAAEARIWEVGGTLWVATSGPASLSRSDDGEIWTPVALPSEALDVHLYVEDGTVWLLSSDPPGAWFLDGTSWVDIGSDMAPPDVTGIRWTLERYYEPARPVSAGDTTVIPWYLGGRADWDTMLDLSPSTNAYGVWDTTTETMEIYGGGQDPLTSLGVEQTGNTLTVKNLESGEVVHEIVINDPRLDPATYFPSLTGALGYTDQTILVVDPTGSVTRVTPPWGGLDGSDGADLIGGDQLVALSQSSDPYHLETWTSPDGVNWSGPSAPGIPVTSEAQGIDFRIEGGVALAEVIGENAKWVSTDGINWSQPRVGGLVDDMNFYRLGSGGIYFDFRTSQLYASSDLLRWEPVDTGDLRTGGGAYGGWAAGDSIFFVVSSDSGRRDMWVLKLQG